MVFSVPIFLRKERGALRLAQLKVQEKQLDFEIKSATLRYRTTTALNEWSNSVGQVEFYARTVQDYSRLLEAEQRLLYVGESSLFLVNSRELSYINAALKLLELLTKSRRASLSTRHALGLLWSSE